MNERIKELAEQAENYAYRVAVGGDECQEAYTEKFAELIVRECLMKVNGAKIRNESYVELIERIKEDFGVE